MGGGGGGGHGESKHEMNKTNGWGGVSKCMMNKTNGVGMRVCPSLQGMKQMSTKQN